VTPFLLAVLATVSPRPADPGTPLADLARRPARYIGLTVRVDVTVADVTADGEYRELVARDRDGRPIGGLKFRAVRGLADAVEGSLDGDPAAARLTGTVLGPDGGRGPYVIQLDEVAILNPDGSVAERHRKPVAVEPPKPAPPPKPEPTPKAEPAPPPPTETTAEPPPAAGGMSPPQMAVLAGFGLLAVGGVGLVVARRGKNAPAPAEQPVALATAGGDSNRAKPAAAGAKPAASVNDRLSRRVR
jgi:hypothetical protein